MTDTEKLTLLKSLLGIAETDMADDVRLAAYLTAAGREIMAWRYSFVAQPDTLPVEYEMTQIYAVIAGFSQSGAENQLSHSENGISRRFKHADMLDYIHVHVIPMVKVV